jgi:hypothetical protein
MASRYGKTMSASTTDFLHLQVVAPDFKNEYVASTHIRCVCPQHEARIFRQWQMPLVKCSHPQNRTARSQDAGKDEEVPKALFLAMLAED